MNQNPKLTRYVSELDHLLFELDTEANFSASQRRDKLQADRVQQLRDQACVVTPVSKLWSKF